MYSWVQELACRGGAALSQAVSHQHQHRILGHISGDTGANIALDCEHWTVTTIDIILSSIIIKAKISIQSVYSNIS